MRAKQKKMRKEEERERENIYNYFCKRKGRCYGRSELNEILNILKQAKEIERKESR